MARRASSGIAGIPIERTWRSTARSSETALLLIYGELPTKETLSGFRKLLTDHEMLHEGLHNMYDGFPAEGHPMAILSAMINACSCYHPDIMVMEDEVTFMAAAARRDVEGSHDRGRGVWSLGGAAALRLPIAESELLPEFPAHDVFDPFREFDPDPDVVSALRLFLILHADRSHEQNCSTSTVRMVASSQANLFASCAAVCALWGPLHGGANMAVIKMLQELHESQIDLVKFMEE